MAKEEEKAAAAANLEAEAQVWKSMLSFTDSMVLRCAVELRIPDIILHHATNLPISLSRLSSLLPSPPPTPTTLLRLMRFLSRLRFFTLTTDTSPSGEPHFSPTPLTPALLSLSSMLLLQTHPSLLSPWHHLAPCVLSGATPFIEAHRMDFLSESAVRVPEFGQLFHGALASIARGTVDAVMVGYGEGFEGVGTVVDVGGGTGATVAEIVRRSRGVKGINFDLPDVVAGAPEYEGVVHVGGDAFEFVPQGDVVFIKITLHCFGDEECLKILRNCKRAIPKTGKIIIVEAVLDFDDDSPLGDIHAKFDMMLLNYTSTGKERTGHEWTELLKLAGFPRVNIIKIPSIWSIIEAFPE